MKYLTTAGLAIVALTWPLFKVSSTEEEEAAAGDKKNEFKASEVNPTEEKRERDADEGIAAREAYRRLQLQDENGQIPPDAWSHAYQLQAEMPFLPEAWSEFLPSGSEVQNPWVSIGPGNVGGRIRSILIHPGTPEIMWAGGVSGGVWKTFNKGDNWSTTTDLLANLAVNCMVMDPTNPDIIYAGTGEGFTNNDFVQGNGIFKTTDGGNYWTQLPFTKDNANFYFVNRLAISPTNPQLLLAATRAGIFRNTNGGEGAWSQSTGLPNGDWTDIRFQPTNGTAEIDIPDVPGINCLAASLYGQVYFSVDNGATWARNAQNGLYPPDDYQRVELAYSRSTPMIVYASQAGTSNRSSELFRSENGGFSFASLGHPHAPTVPGGLPTAYYYANALWVDPINPDTIAVGGQYLLISKDRGAHWQEAGTGSHLDVHMILEHPGYDGTTNKIAYSTNDGGIHLTGNILAGSPTPIPGGYVRWTSRNNALGVTQFYGAAGHVATGVIIGGTQDNGTVRFQPSGGPENWQKMADGDAGFCAVDQTSNPYFYGENVALQIYRSTNGGGKASYIWDGIPHPPECGGVPCANFTAPFVLDPNLDQENEQKTILAGGRSLWRTTDSRAADVSWPEIKAPTPLNCIANNNCTYINAIAVAEGDSDLIWVGYGDGSVFYTTNGTDASPTWTRVDGTVLPNRLCTRITIAPPLPSGAPDVPYRKVYVTFAGFSFGNVWKTENNGATWINIHPNNNNNTTLPNVPVFSLVVSPSNPQILYIGTEIGVFASGDGGDTWSPGSGVPARTRIAELFWMGPKLVAATHGRGIFTLSPPGN